MRSHGFKAATKRIMGHISSLKNREFEPGIVQIDFRRMFSVHTPVAAVQSRLRWRPPQGDIELIAEKHVFSFKPTSRLEHIGDEHVERVQDRKH